MSDSPFAAFTAAALSAEQERLEAQATLQAMLGIKPQQQQQAPPPPLQDDGGQATLMALLGIKPQQQEEEEGEEEEEDEEEKERQKEKAAKERAARREYRERTDDRRKKKSGKPLQKPRLSKQMEIKVSDAILEGWERDRPTAEETERKRQLAMRLQSMLPRFALYPFGSTASGFCMRGGDLDLCAITDAASAGKDAEIVEELAKQLELQGFTDVLGLPNARIPIVKFKSGALKVDICFNNPLALRNTRLLYTYAQLDERVVPMVLAVKRWAKARRVNSTFEGTLSSYAYVILVISSLQNLKPPVLPYLQENTAGGSHIVDGFETFFNEQPEPMAERNTEPLGRLLYRFFYYLGFLHNYKDHVITIRTRERVTKKEKEWTKAVVKETKSNYWFCIEDPFELSHNLARTVDKGSLFNMRYEFRRAAHVLAGSFPLRDHTYEDPIEALCLPYSKDEKQVKV